MVFPEAKILNYSTSMYYLCHYLKRILMSKFQLPSNRLGSLLVPSLADIVLLACYV